MRKGLFIIAILLAAAALPREAAAQNVVADVLRLRGGPCTARAGTGSPEGVVAGIACDTFEDRTTGQIYKKVGTGLTGWYPVLGPSAATCTTFAGCVAQSLSTDYLTWTQKLRTDNAFQFRSSVTEGGTRLESYNGGGWMPLILGGGPTRVKGGGFHVGASDILDPGLGNAQIDGFLGKPEYVSQLIGWRIDALGAADFRYIFTDELHAKAFIADLEQALAGGQIIAKSVSVVGAAFTAPAAGGAETLTVRDLPSAPGMAVFQSGDHVRLREFSRSGGELTISDAWGVVTDHADIGDGLQAWTFTRGSGVCSGAMAGGTVVQPDAILIDYGVSGNGFYEVSAIDGVYGVNSPYAQIATWAGDCPIAANVTLRTRLGNLRGITGVTGEFGLLAGTYAATGGQYVRISSEKVELHGVNFSLWDGSTKVIELNRTAPSLAIGSPLPSAYGTGTGIWMGKDSGVYKARVGVPGGFGWFFDGTKLTWSAANTSLDASGNLTATSATLSGSITATTGAIGGWSIGATALTAGSGATTVGLDSGGTNPAIYAGSATPGSAPFRVTNAGAVTATSGAIGGWTLGATSLTAGSGATTVGLDSGGSNPAFYAGSATPAAATFRVTAAGALTATSATISGTITGSTITGSTATFGSVTLDGSGVTFAAGSGAGNQVKWSDGAWIYSDGSNGMSIAAGGHLRLGANSNSPFVFDGTSIYVDGGSGPGFGGLGTSSQPWGNVFIGGEFKWYGGPSTTDSNDYPLVYSTGNEQIYRKTDGSDGTFCGGGLYVTDITIERGIVTGVGCGTEPRPASAQAATSPDYDALVSKLLNDPRFLEALTRIVALRHQ